MKRKPNKRSIHPLYEQQHEWALCHLVAERKWQHGYRCRRCEGTAWGKGDRVADRRCRHCGYNETPTAHTVLHHLRISLSTAKKLWQSWQHEPGRSARALGREFGVNPKTVRQLKLKFTALDALLSDPE